MRLIRRSLYHFEKRLTTENIDENTIEGATGARAIKPILAALIYLDVPAPGGIEVIMTVIVRPNGGSSLEDYRIDERYGYLWLHNTTEENVVVPVIGVDLSSLFGLLREGGPEKAGESIVRLLEEGIPGVIETLRKSTAQKKDKKGETGKQIEEQDQNKNGKTGKQIELVRRFLFLAESGGQLLDDKPPPSKK